MFHGDLGRVLDLVDVHAVKRRQCRRGHRTGTPDLRLTAALRTGDAGICSDHISDDAGYRQRVDDLVLGEAAVLLHVIHDRRQYAAAAAGGGGNHHVLVRVLFTHCVSIGRNHTIHGNVGALVIAALGIEQLCLA